MHPMRLMGWGLLAAAFFAAAMETAAQSMTGSWGTMSARSVLAVMFPYLFEAFRDGIDATLAPWVWDYVVSPVLILPGWFLLTVPGVLLIWHFRPPADPNDGGQDAFPETTYEDIVAAAREADEDDIGIPSKYRDLDEYDPTRQPAIDDIDPALDPLYLDQADVVPPARHIPSGGVSSGSEGGGTANGSSANGGFGSGLNRPF